MLVALAVWAWLDQHDGGPASHARRAFCLALLLVGFAVVSAETGLRRFRTTLILAGACGAFMAVVWHVVESATSHMALCGIPVG